MCCGAELMNTIQRLYIVGCCKQPHAVAALLCICLLYLYFEVLYMHDVVSVYVCCLVTTLCTRDDAKGMLPISSKEQMNFCQMHINWQWKSNSSLQSKA